MSAPQHTPADGERQGHAMTPPNERDEANRKLALDLLGEYGYSKHAQGLIAAHVESVAGPLRAALEKCREVFHHWDGNSVTAGHFRQLVEAKELTEAALRPANPQPKST